MCVNKWQPTDLTGLNNSSLNFLRTSRETQEGVAELGKLD